jgi:hypothetical protein
MPIRLRSPFLVGVALSLGVTACGGAPDADTDSLRATSTAQKSSTPIDFTNIPFNQWRPRLENDTLVWTDQQHGPNTNAVMIMDMFGRWRELTPPNTNNINPVKSGKYVVYARAPGAVGDW